MAEIYKIPGIYKILFLSYNGKIQEFEPSVLAKIIQTYKPCSVGGDNGNSRPSNYQLIPIRDDKVYRPIQAYYIPESNMNSDYKPFSASDGAWHKNKYNETINNKECTQFYKLFYHDKINELTINGWKMFNPNDQFDTKNWLCTYQKGDDDFVGYFRVFYRDRLGYILYNNCLYADDQNIESDCIIKIKEENPGMGNNLCSNVYGNYSMVKTDEILQSGNSIFSPNTNYRLQMQCDGHLVIYGKEKDKQIVKWSSGKFGSVEEYLGCYLKMQTDGNLVCYKRDGSSYWSSNTIAYNCVLVIDNNGKIIIYSRND